MNNKECDSMIERIKMIRNDNAYENCKVKLCYVVRMGDFISHFFLFFMDIIIQFLV